MRAAAAATCVGSKSLRSGYSPAGQSSCSTSRRGSGWPSGHDPEQVVHLALVPVRRRHARRDRRVARVVAPVDPAARSATVRPSRRAGRAACRPKPPPRGAVVGADESSARRRAGRATRRRRARSAERRAAASGRAGVPRSRIRGAPSRPRPDVRAPPARARRRAAAAPRGRAATQRGQRRAPSEQPRQRALAARDRLRRGSPSAMPAEVEEHPAKTSARAARQGARRPAPWPCAEAGRQDRELADEDPERRRAGDREAADQQGRAGERQRPRRAADARPCRRVP